MTEEVKIKCVVVGDGYVGKTCMIMSYCQDTFPEQHIPTVFDNYIATLEIDKKPIKLAIWDTAGQDDYERLRTLSYSMTDVFLVCFSLVDKESFKNALNKWIPELFQNAPNAPIILVGTKSDLKKEYEGMPEKQAKVVPQSDGLKAVQQHNLFNYVECSAKTQDNLNRVFSDAIRSVFKYRQLLNTTKRRKRVCSTI